MVGVWGRFGRMEAEKIGVDLPFKPIFYMFRAGMSCFLVVLVVFSSCAPSYKSYMSRFRPATAVEKPDYSDLFFWAAHPDKWDPSDSIPRPLRKSYQYDTTSDVIFLHPTTLTDEADSSANASLNDAALNAKTNFSPILFQASAFNEHRVFAPRYRQAHIRNYYVYLNDTAKAMKAFQLAYEDVRSAFLYYLKHYNNGRPVIIASHSQGTTHALWLLKEFFDKEKPVAPLVAAYLVGMYIPKDQFTYLKPCEQADQTNCFCAWRTFKLEHVPDFVQKEVYPSPVTNPLSWTRDTTPVDRHANPGSILTKFNKKYRYAAGAQIHGGILWTPRPHFFGSFMLKTPNYHIGDINLYYYSIRNNLRTRIKAWRQQHP